MDYYENGVAGGELAISVSGPPPPPVPTVPTYLTGTPVFNGIQLNWVASSSATYYKVYRAPAVAGGSYGLPTTVYDTNFLDTTGTPGTAYFYDVRACNDNGSSLDAVTNPAITYPSPSVPSGLTAAPASGGISLQWNSLPGAISWNIYRAAAGSAYSFYASTGGNSYLDSGTASSPLTVPGTTYYYQITAVNSSSNESGRSNPANAVFPYTYAGYVDGLSRNGISGWAKDTRLPSQTLNVDLYDGATLFLTVPAANLRSDSGIGYHGFLLATPARLLDGQTHTVSLKYGGTNISLNGSPGVIDPAAASSLYGWLDQANRSAVGGWTQDSAQPSTSLTVDLYDGTTFIQTVSTNIARGDVQPGSHGFSVATPAQFLDGATHVLHARYGGTSTELHGSPVTFSPPAASSLYGWLDGAGLSGISGWTQDSAQPSTSLTVDLYDGATYFQTVPTNIARGDVQPGNHGFLLATPARLMDGQPHVLHARYGGTATELHGSPVTLTLVPSLTVPNFSFETPSLGAGGWGAPAGATWTFGGPGGGMAANASAFTSANPNAPDGVQVGVLQGPGTISQAIPGFVANTSYTVTVAAAQRASGNSSSQTVQVSLDGVVVGAFTPTSRSYADYTVNYTAPASGSHTLTFTGTNPRGGDNSALIDNIRIVKIVNPDFGVSTDTFSASLSLADGASYDGGPLEALMTATPYNGFTGDVTFSLSYLDASGNLHSGAPGGMYYWFGPATDADEGVGLVTISDPNSQDTLLSICSCEGNPTLGIYTLVVTATSGSVSKKTSLTLTITN